MDLERLMQSEPVNMLANNLDTYYFEDRHHQEKYMVGAEDGEPYYIICAEKSYIPVSIVLFAHSLEDAKERFVSALRLIGERYQYNIDAEDLEDEYEKTKENDAFFHLSRLHKINSMVRRGYIKVGKLNKGLILKAPWAGNDYLA